MVCLLGICYVYIMDVDNGSKWLWHGIVIEFYKGDRVLVYDPKTQRSQYFGFVAGIAGDGYYLVKGPDGEVERVHPDFMEHK